jgi:hypothetical protein
MAKVRSPAYPGVGLKEAIERIAAVYKEDYQNPIPRDVVARHMGYQGLSGKSLGVLSALGKYGLLEGRGNESRVSDLAVRIIAHAPGEPERSEAIREAASRPELFNELDQRFQNGRGSDTAIRSYLIVQKFIPPAADTVLRAYRETKQLVETESVGYNGSSVREENPVPTQQPMSHIAHGSSASPQSVVAAPEEGSTGGRRAVFALTEGDVIISFPEDLSPESVEDLADYLEIFMKKARREAGLAPKKADAN